jgi:hypothetical protein
VQVPDEANSVVDVRKIGVCIEQRGSLADRNQPRERGVF